MEQHDAYSNTNDDAAELISLTDLLATIWHGRWTIVVITLLVTAGGLSLSLLSKAYKSEGFFHFGGPIPKDQQASDGIALADYKRYAASYGTSERFVDFIQDKKLASTEGVNDLRSAFSSRNGISKLIEPIYPFTKVDAKELMGQPKDSGNNVVGLRINYTSRSPQLAQQMAGLLGRYAMDSIIYSIYFDALHFKPDEIRTKLAKLDNVIISNRVQLEEYRRKVTDLKEIIARNRGNSTSGQDGRQVVTIAEDSARYLPPGTLLMATEVQASATNEATLKAKREQQQNALLLEYYERAKLMLNATKSGETVLHSLEALKASVFKDKNLQDDTVKEVYNMITVDNQSAINLYLNKSRFIAGPTRPGYSTARPVMMVAVSVLLGLFLALIVVFGRKWWRDNKGQLSAQCITTN